MKTHLLPQRLDLWQVAQRTECSQRLMCILQEKRAQHSQLQGQLKEAQDEWNEVVAAHVHLQTEVRSMRRSLEVDLQTFTCHALSMFCKCDSVTGHNGSNVIYIACLWHFVCDCTANCQNEVLKQCTLKSCDLGPASSLDFTTWGVCMHSCARVITPYNQEEHMHNATTMHAMPSACFENCQFGSCRPLTFKPVEG